MYEVAFGNGKLKVSTSGISAFCVYWEGEHGHAVREITVQEGKKTATYGFQRFYTPSYVDGISGLTEKKQGVYIDFSINQAMFRRGTSDLVSERVGFEKARIISVKLDNDEVIKAGKRATQLDQRVAEASAAASPG
jgi:hypothetical protein